MSNEIVFTQNDFMSIKDVALSVSRRRAADRLSGQVVARVCQTKHAAPEPPLMASFRFQIDTTLGAKPQTVQAYGKAKQQGVGLIWI